MLPTNHSKLIHNVTHSHLNNTWSIQCNNIDANDNFGSACSSFLLKSAWHLAHVWFYVYWRLQYIILKVRKYISVHWMQHIYRKFYLHLTEQSGRSYQMVLYISCISHTVYRTQFTSLPLMLVAVEKQRDKQCVCMFTRISPKFAKV